MLDQTQVFTPSGAVYLLHAAAAADGFAGRRQRSDGSSPWRTRRHDGSAVIDFITCRYVVKSPPTATCISPGGRLGRPSSWS